MLFLSYIVQPLTSYCCQQADVANTGDMQVNATASSLSILLFVSVHWIQL